MGLPGKPRILLPEGYQKVPGEEFIAVSKSGDVLNYHTNLPILVRHNDPKGPHVRIYESDRSVDPRNSIRVRYVSDLVAEAFGDTPDDEKSNFEPDTETPIQVNPIDPHQYKKTIDITSPAIMLEAMRQIRMGMGQHYFEGPLRTKTLKDAVDHLIRKLEGGNNG